MSYPTWPDELPRPARQAYSRQASDPRRRRATEIGPPEYRRRASLVPEAQGLQFSLQRGEYERLMRFFETETDRGTRYFYMPDFLTHGWPLADALGRMVSTPDGRPLLASAMMLCAWGEQPPRLTGLQGLRMTVAVEIVVLP